MLTRFTSIVLVAALAVSAYLLIALPLLQDHDTAGGVSDRRGEPPGPVARASDLDPARSDPRVDKTIPDTAIGGSGSRLIEIFGRVEAADGQPLEDVLVTEERYFFAARSDADGNYRLLLELPWHRLPIVNFLRAGYQGKRIELTRRQLQDRAAYQLDVELADSSATRRIEGWVANDIGVGLEGVRITVKTRESAPENNHYLTVFSDDRGNFTLEGLQADSRYQLTAMLAPEYPIYTDDNFYLGSEPQSVQIVLQSLKFVTLGGMILASDGGPVANLEFYITNLSTGLHTRKIVSDSSGFFSLDDFPLGAVSLTTRGAEFHKITGLVIDESNYSNLVLTIDRGDRHLYGWVSDPAGLPIRKAMVTLDNNRIVDGVEYFAYRSQTTDANGHFEFSGIATGEQRISVYATGYDKLEVTRYLDAPSEQLRLSLNRP